MSDLRIESWTMPAAELGPDNPLPPLGGMGGLHASKRKEGMPSRLRDSIAWGHPTSILPYTMQDEYSRVRQSRHFRIAVLENESLRATFLLEFGGRLWSLVHKPSGRELLYVNPVFQPANLAMRNAWFSGGVEWNVSIIGHSPFTCAPLFAAEVNDGKGNPILRLYEWERVRQIPFQIDFYLPDGSPALLVRVCIVNPHRLTIPMYWWSNIAAPETPQTRVFVPAQTAYRFNYRGLDVVPLPVADGVDQTFASSLPNSADFFYQIPVAQRPWIAVLDGEGTGLLHTSTDLLKGRKLFVWGMGSGGRRWQEFLSQEGDAYIEIQAGLCETQMEYATMPPETDWVWLEAYAPLELDARAWHSDDWAKTQQSIEDVLERTIPRQSLEAELLRSKTWADQRPSDLLQCGSGWGALECSRRNACGEPPFQPPGMLFDDASLGKAQSPWLELLRTGTMPRSDPTLPPAGYMVQPEWRTLLEQAVEKTSADNWEAWLHLGIMRYWAGDRAAARTAWERSFTEGQNVWALINLATVALDEGRQDDAADLFVSAYRMQPSFSALAIACGRGLIEAQRPQQWLDLLGEMQPSLRNLGRIRLLEAQAALAVGALDIVSKILAEHPVVDDIREGETSLSHLWFAYHEHRISMEEGQPIDEALRVRVREQFPIPKELDFRMIVEDARS